MERSKSRANSGQTAADQLGAWTWQALADPERLQSKDRFGRDSFKDAHRPFAILQPS